VIIMSESFFKSVGGRKEFLAGADPNDPASVTWNFGLKPAPLSVEAKVTQRAGFYERFPKLKGKWDGKTEINHYAAVVKVLGDKSEDLIQHQPRGTCGGRAGAITGDFVQCIMIAAGKSAKFTRVSHAAVYYAARKLYNMLEGDWRDDDEDGVAHGSVPEALTKVTGFVGRDESGDTKWYGAGSDDLACKLGAGMLPELGKKIITLGSDNLIKDWAVVTSAEEAADALASGAFILGSDSQGFTMSRDSNGFCNPRGTWHHYHARPGIKKAKNGRWGFPYWQSWGKELPGGTKLEDYPGNCFLVDWDVQDRLFRKGKYAAVWNFDPIEMAEDKINVDWKF
jgi:hypothetical protein